MRPKKPFVSLVQLSLCQRSASLAWQLFLQGSIGKYARTHPPTDRHRLWFGPEQILIFGSVWPIRLKFGNNLGLSQIEFPWKFQVIWRNSFRVTVDLMFRFTSIDPTRSLLREGALPAWGPGLAPPLIKILHEFSEILSQLLWRLENCIVYFH